MRLSERLRDLPVRYRVLAVLLGMVLISEAGTAFLIFSQYRASMISQSVGNLADIRSNRIHDIRTALLKISIDNDLISSLPGVIEYLSRNTQPADMSSDPIIQGIIGTMRYMQENTRLHDVLIINNSGKISLTLANERDAGSSLLSGPYKTSELASAYQQSQTLLQTSISGVAFYEPSGEPAMFLVSPVIHGNRLLGAVAAQIDWDGLVGILTSIAGLGKTGEVVAGIIHGDHAYLAPLRNMKTSRFDLQIPMGSDKAGPIQQAVRGNVGSGFDKDYRGIDVVAAWGYIPELQMGIVVKIDADELLAPVTSMLHLTLLIVACIMLLTSLIGYFLARSITNPINELTESALQYANGNQEVRSRISSRDEIGLLSMAFNSMADNIARNIDTIQKKNLALTQASLLLEQKVAERTATLATANEEIKSFAYIVSHDLRSPLVNIKGFTGELGLTLNDISQRLEHIADKVDAQECAEVRRLISEDVPESIRFISSSADKMDVMLTAILKLSRLGRRELIIETIDLHELCSNIMQSLDFQIRETNTEISLGQLPEINNDRVVMEQIMGNLIGNAIKYLSHERPGKISVWSEKTNHGITISVRDNGRGISDDEKEKVFQIFRRGRHQDVVGEGMGLAYVQTLVRAQNGSVSYTSAEDKGSTFNIYLPFIEHTEA